ncbi:CYTH domain-containing protein [Bacillus sonorensis]|nr:CYTH domain-containing protein [Bacillus sonorensis]
MSQELEIEFKNMLTKEEFEQISTYYQFTSEQFVTQQNHYFDTKEFSLKEKGAALRIRQKQDVHVLTLKEPSARRLDGNPPKAALPAGSRTILHSNRTRVRPFERSRHRTWEPRIFRYACNRPRRKKRPEGLIVLDRSRYLKVEDYEIEFEVADYEQGKLDFAKLLKSFGIPKRDTKNKIVRFYEQKLKNI